MQTNECNCVVVMTTVASRDEADRIAQKLVEARLAACVQCHAVDSTYRWQGRIEQAGEFMLTCKTTARQAAPLQALIAELHSYEVPEITVMPLAGGSEAYLAWIEAETGREQTG